MTFNKRITTAIATGAVLINALAPVAFASTVTVTGNGAFSNNAVNTSVNNTTTVNQTNVANINNTVNSSASTGGNSSNFNTGGDSRIVTGNATTNTSITNAANLNKASVANCGNCNGGATNVTVSGNGAYSDNGVAVNKANEVFLNQNNAANVLNDVNAKASTGKNDNSFNTGGDSVTVTGNAKTDVNVLNKANANEAVVGGGHGLAGESSLTITGNGAFSGNGVALDQNSAVVLSQNNVANLANYVDAKAKTGYNDSTFNTGGFVGISTGNATTNVGVDNMVNFNAANVGCDCVLGETDVKIGGNGADSWNAVDANDDNALFNAQVNAEALLNNVDGNAKTGSNDVSFSTADVHGDPLVVTGNSNSSTHVNNSGNANSFSNGASVTLPGNWNVGVNFDLFGFWAQFSSMVM